MNILNRLQQKIGQGAGPGGPEILAAVEREMRAQRKIFSAAVLAPDHYRVELSPADYQALRPFLQALTRELAQAAADLPRKNGFRTSADPVVTIDRAAGLENGVIRVTGRFTGPMTAERDNRKQQPTLQLIIAEGAGHQETRSLASGTYMIGRGREADIFPLVEDSLMSRNHCLLTFQEGEIIIQDLGSANGMVVNDRKVAHARLTAGDSFMLGDTIFRVNS